MKADLKRRELRVANSAQVVSVTQREMALNKKKLKADIKKTEKLLKKVRVIGDGNGAAVCAEIRKLNLKRYVAEVAAGVSEAELKKRADVVAAVSLCSTMHSLYVNVVGCPGDQRTWPHKAAWVYVRLRELNERQTSLKFM